MTLLTKKICKKAPSIIIASTIIGINILGIIKSPSIIKSSLHFTEAVSAPVIIAAVSLFILMINYKMKGNRFINVVGKSTFGVLLIHDNQYVRDYLWNDLFKNAHYAGSRNLFLREVIVVLLVFASCIVIDIVRIKFFEKPVVKILSLATKAKPNAS